jgi:Tfp pilus assembly protein PilX
MCVYRVERWRDVAEKRRRRGFIIIIIIIIMIVAPLR